MPTAVPHRRRRAPERTRRRDLIRMEGVRLARPRAGRGEERRLDVRLWLDLWEAARHNRIERTVDYRRVHRLVRAVGRQPGRDLAERLVEAILKRFPRVDGVEVRTDGGVRTRCRRARRAENGPGRAR